MLLVPLAVAVFVAGFSYLNTPQEAVGYSRIIGTDNILGTGTSTPKTYNFGAAAATTSPSIVRITEATDIYDIDLYPESASSSAHVNVQIGKSSLPRCSNASANVLWVDANTQIAASAASLTLQTGTTTWYWKPVASSPMGARIQLTNLNTDCLKFYVGGQSVNLYIQGTRKALSF